MATQEAHDRPDYKNSAYERMKKYWDISEPMFDGHQAMMDAEFEFLEKFASETSGAGVDRYNARKRHSPFFNVYGQTIKSTVGVMFADDITPENVPKALEDNFRDIDCCGNNLHSFLRTTALNGIKAGHSFILVTAPPKPQTDGNKPTTLADVAGRRAYWINVKANQANLNASANENGRDIPTSVSIYDPQMEKQGRFGEVLVEQYKEFVRGLPNQKGMCFVWRKLKNKQGNDEWQIVDEMELATREIPLVPYYTNKTGFFESIPPYMDLCKLNLDHYNLTSDLKYALKYCIPISVFKFDNKKDADEFSFDSFAAHNILKIYGDNADAFHLELQGQSIEALEKQVHTREEQMAKTGMEMFSPTRDMSEKTAYEVKSDDMKNLSQIGVFAFNLENAVASAFDLTIETEQAIKNETAVSISDEEKAELRLNFDYKKLNYNLQQLEFVAKEKDAGRLSLSTFLEVLEAARIMPKTWTPEVERERLADEFAVESERNKIDGTVVEPSDDE